MNTNNEMSHGINILLVEDNVLTAEQTMDELRGVCSKLDHVISGEEAVKLVKEHTIHLVLMDIGLAGPMDGIEASNMISQFAPNLPIIYLTVQSESFLQEKLKDKVYGHSILRKPVDPIDLRINIEMALKNMGADREMLDVENKTDLPEQEIKESQEEGEMVYMLEDRFFVRKGERFHAILLDKILWVRADQAYSQIKVEGVEDVFILSMNLAKFARKIDHPYLIRVHRSFLINLKMVTAFEGNMIFVKKHEIPIGPSYREKLIQRFKTIDHRKGKTPE